MKKKEIAAALDALRKIKIMQIEDKEIRNAIISNHLKLIGIYRKYNEEFEDARTAFLSSYGKEQNEVMKLDNELKSSKDPDRQEDILKKIDSYKGYLEAVKEFNEKVSSMGEEEVELIPVGADKFVEEYQKQDYDMSVVEALYPMLN